MYQNKLKNLHEAINGVSKVRLDAEIGKNSWIGTGGKADLLVLPENTEQLSSVLTIYAQLFPQKTNASIPRKMIAKYDIKSDKIHSWMLIEAAGLRGYSIGGAEVSRIHCNFLVNKGGATAEDFEKLGEYVIQKVYEKFQVQLEWEVERIGDFL